MKKTLLVVAVSMAFLAGCGEDKPVANPVPPGVFAQQAAQAQAASAPVAAPVAPTAPAAAPVIINQAPAAHSDNGLSNALAGAALGYALGSAGNNSRGYEPRYNDRSYDYGRDRYYSRPTVVNKTVIVKQYVKEVPKAAPVVTPPPMKSVVVPPSKVIPAAPSPVTPTTAKKLSLDKPKTTSSFSSSPSKSSSFGGFSRRK